MSTQKLTADELKTMTVAQILELTMDQVEELKPFERYPEGVVVGTIREWKLPEKEGEGFTVFIDLQQYAEFKNPEEAESFQLKEGASFSQRYNTGVGIQALVTEWKEVLPSFNGNIGAMMANTAGAAVTFEMTKRIDRKRLDADGKPSVYNGMSKVHLS